MKQSEAAVTSQRCEAQSVCSLAPDWRSSERGGATHSEGDSLQAVTAHGEWRRYYTAGELAHLLLRVALTLCHRQEGTVLPKSLCGPSAV